MSTKKDRGKRLTQDVASKVQDLKTRQQKWMEDRNKYLNQTTPQAPSSKTDSNDTNYFSSATKQNQHIYSPDIYRTTDSDDEEDFNTKADKIALDVKQRLNVRSVTGSLSSASPASSGSPLPAHLCSRCKAYMLAPEHVPMMLIPCGHNVCLKCCNLLEFCHMCSIEITSHSVNTMLQQIIMESGTPGSSDRLSHTQNQSRRVSDKHDSDQRRQVISMRQEALKEELGNLEVKIRGIERDIKEEHSQIAGIERKEADIVNEISELQRKIMTLQQHKAEFKDKISLHKTRIATEQKKMNLISETLAELDEQMRILTT